MPPKSKKTAQSKASAHQVSQLEAFYRALFNMKKYEAMVASNKPAKALLGALPKFKGQTLGANAVLKALSGDRYSTTPEASRNVFYGWTVPTLVQLISQTGIGTKAEVDFIGPIGGTVPAEVAAAKLAYYNNTVDVLKKCPPTLDTIVKEGDDVPTLTAALAKLPVHMPVGAKDKKGEKDLTSAGNLALHKLEAAAQAGKKVSAAAAASSAYKRAFKIKEIKDVKLAMKNPAMVGGPNGDVIDLKRMDMITNTALKLIDDSAVRAILKAMGKRSIVFADVVTIQTALKLEFFMKFLAQENAQKFMPMKKKISETFFSGSDVQYIPKELRVPLKCSPLWTYTMKTMPKIVNTTLLKHVEDKVKGYKKPPASVYVGSLAQSLTDCVGGSTTASGSYVPFAPAAMDNLLAFTYTGTLLSIDTDMAGKSASKFEHSLDDIMKFLMPRAYELIPLEERPCESLQKARSLARLQNAKALQA